MSGGVSDCPPKCPRAEPLPNDLKLPRASTLAPWGAQRAGGRRPTIAKEGKFPTRATAALPSDLNTSIKYAVCCLAHGPQPPSLSKAMVAVGLETSGAQAKPKNTLQRLRFPMPVASPFTCPGASGGTCARKRFPFGLAGASAARAAAAAASAAPATADGAASSGFGAGCGQGPRLVTQNGRSLGPPRTRSSSTVNCLPVAKNTGNTEG